MSIVVGTASYSNGEQQFFTDPKEFIKTVHEELPDRGSSGFMFKVMAADPETRKAIDDIVIGESGDTNEHEIAYYQNSDSEHKEKALEGLNTALYEKMYAEQETYRSWLLSQPPEEILKHTYEYTVREDILLSLEYNDLSMEQASALLVSKAPLDDVFQDFEKIETDHMAIVQDCVSSRADSLLQQEKEQQLAVLNMPVYRYPASYAHEHGELEQFRASHKTNIACRDAIDTAIADNYRNNALGHGAVKQVVDQYGYNRTLFVLANTVRCKGWDGRISDDNKRWAMTVPVYEDKDAWGDDRNREFVVDRAHPGLVDLFTTQVRHDFLLTQPLTKEDVQHEATRILAKLQEPMKPNSPSGTHFMAQISPDFAARATSKHMDKLMDMLPFQSICFTGLDGRKGLFATITADEDRFQPLRQHKPSVRDKLQAAPAVAKPTPVVKSKELER